MAAAIRTLGLEKLLCRANHIAITVTDIERSLDFYCNVLGLTQIKRPNFDRDGAWLSMGNIELHLIRGTPLVPSESHLLVGHISLETENIKEVLRRLQDLAIPFVTNVSLATQHETCAVITQFFMKDPDGYYIELCNCLCSCVDILAELCIDGTDFFLEGHQEHIEQKINLEYLSKVANLAKISNDNMKLTKEDLESIGQQFHPDEKELEKNLLTITFQPKNV